MQNLILYMFVLTFIALAGSSTANAQGKKSKHKTETPINNNTEITDSDANEPVLKPESTKDNTKKKNKKTAKNEKNNTPDAIQQTDLPTATEPKLIEPYFDEFADEVITNPEELTEEEVAKRLAYFNKDNWKNATEKARKERKVLVADFYTDWCRACKQMDREIFIHQEARELLNRHFVPYKAHAEKSDKSVAEMYGVTAYPTFIFFDSDGKELKRIEGYMGKESFMKQLKQFKPRIPNTQHTPFR